MVCWPLAGTFSDQPCCLPFVFSLHEICVWLCVWHWKTMSSPLEIRKKSYSSQMICNGSFWHNSVFLSQINWNVSSYKGFSKFWQNCNLVSSYCELYLVICEPGFFTQFFSLLFWWVGITFMPTEPFLQSFPCSLWQLVLGSLSGWTNVSWWWKPDNKKCIHQVLENVT